MQHPGSWKNFTSLALGLVSGVSAQIMVLPSVALGHEILVIESYTENAPNVIKSISGMDSIFSDEFDITYAFMDTKRIPAEDFEKAALKAWEVYDSQKPDLVILGDDNALKYLGPKLADAETPVVFKGVSENPRHYFPDKRVPANFSGLLERPHFPETVSLIKEIAPVAHNRISFLLDTSRTSEAIIQNSFHGRTSHVILDTDVDLSLLVSYKQWQKAILEAGQSYDALVLITLHTLLRENGETVPYWEAMEWANKNAPVPIFGILEFQVANTGVVGTVSISHYTHGQQAAEIASSILHAGSQPHNHGLFIDRVSQTYLNLNNIEKFGLKVPDRARMNLAFR